MEFPSKNLLLTLAQDLKIINNVNKEISFSCSGVKINSWLYPSKSYEEVSEISLSTHKSGKDLYLNYLELIIDRLHFMINLLIKFTETLIKKDFSRNVAKPNNLALGTCSNYLWKTLSQLKDFIIRRSGEVNRNENDFPDMKTLVDKNTQTLTSFAEICNSCGFATECIHEIVNGLALHIDETFIDKIREDFREDLFDITMQGRMHQVTGTIIQDLKIFGEHAKKLEQENKRQLNEIRHLETNFAKSLFTIKTLRRSVKKFRKRAIGTKIKKECLIKRINELIKTDSVKTSKMLRANDKSEMLEKSLRESTISLALLSTDNDNLQREITHTLKENIGMSSEKNLWKERFGESYLENRKLKQELNVIRPEILALTTSISKLSQSCENFMEKLQESTLKLTRKSEAFESVMKKLTEDLPSVRGSDGSTSSAFKITGNPLADMRKQVELNIFNIKKLEQHNNRLLRTIARVQSKVSYN